MPDAAASVTRRLVAGGEADFMAVFELSLAGSHAAIGRALAHEARSQFGFAPRPADPLVARARRRWFERNWPQHHARMIGVAECFGLDPECDAVDVSDLDLVTGRFGCSVAVCPPRTTADGRGRIGRNFDFFTGSWRELLALLGAPASPGAAPEPPMASRPYVLRVAPEHGPACTAINFFGFDGCMEGINADGLAVALLLADVRTVAPPAAPRPRAGLNENQVPRFLLDTCSDVPQAKEALLCAKQYDTGAACHYAVADAAGRGFVWERGEHGSEHIIETEGPLCVTNHPLHLHPDLDHLPDDDERSHQTYQRIRTLSRRTAGPALSPAALRDALDEVAAVEDPAWRTLWRSVFDLDRRSLAVRFYLGDGPDGRPRYSEECVFRPGVAPR
jgi:hypothetical protein